MNEVIEKLCRIKTQYAINKLNPSSTDMIFIQYEELCLELNKQLQSYKQKEEEYKQIISGLEIIKEHNMPNDTKFVIMAKEDYLRNLELLNEGDNDLSKNEGDK